jgi:hypothetical protein
MRAALVLGGGATWLVGMRVDNTAVRWAGMGLLFVALLARFLPAGKPGEREAPDEQNSTRDDQN